MLKHCRSLLWVCPFVIISAYAPLVNADSSAGVAAPEFALAIERGRNIVAPVTRRGSGVSVAVGVDGQLVWSEGFGFTEHDGDKPVTPDTQFRAYSLMKQVTTVLALQQVLQGKLGFASSPRAELPNLPSQFDDVTLLQLLTHMSGVRHYATPAEALMSIHCTRADEGLALFTGDPLVHAPGVRQTYSTFGFMLASAVLEANANSSFPELLRTQILMPAGMQSTVPDTLPLPPGAAGFFDVDTEGRLHVAPEIDNSCKMGGGGFLTTAADIVRFHNAVLSGQLVPEAAVRQMLGERSALSAGGSGVGGEAVSVVDLDTRISVVVLSNTGGLEQQIALDRVRDLLVAVFNDS